MTGHATNRALTGPDTEKAQAGGSRAIQGIDRHLTA